MTKDSDKPNTAPAVGPLADNGGFTKTHALLPSSPAINAGSNTSVPPTDQRGMPRIVAGIVDIGAYEVQDDPGADAGADAGDAGDASADAGDAGDAGPRDAGTDAGSRDAGRRDAGLDSGADAGDGNSGSSGSDGCDCVAAGGGAYGTGPVAAASALAFALLFARRRRRGSDGHRS